MRARPSLCLAIAAAMLAGCVPLSPAAAPVGAAAAARKAAGPGQALPGAIDVAPGAAIGAGVVSNNGGSLIGKVKAPASLVSNNGGGIISDKGLGYRVQALEQVPVAGAKVALLDASGQPVMKDGQPIETTTDAAGGYALEVDFQPSNWQLRVGLPQGRGQLAAFVPGGDEAREVGVDLVSTLTTTYILERYVKAQSDAQQTLDKLPPAVEAETRQKAQAALEGGAVAVPESLETARVLETVEALRQQDATFDQQMETVKKLLVAAGLSDLGNGQVATEVFLPQIRQALPAPDGSVYLNCGLIWRLMPDGTLTRVTGATTTEALAVDGLHAADARLRAVSRMALDAEGRLWLLEDAKEPRLTRIEQDGRIREIAHGLTNIRQIAPTGGESFLAIAGTRYGEPATLYAVTPGQAPEALHRFEGLDAEVAYGARIMSRDVQGRLAFCGLLGMSITPKAYRFDPASKTMSLVKAAMVDGAWDVALDGAGRIYYEVKDAKTVRMLAPDGSDTLLPGLQDIDFVSGIAMGPNGAVYLVGGKDDNSLYRWENGQRVLVAGKEGQGTVGGDPTAIALKAPESMAVGQGGEMYVVDEGAVLRFAAAGGASTLLAAGALKSGGVSLTPSQLKRGADGALYMLGTDPSQSLFARVTPLFRLVEGQAPEVIHTPPGELTSYAVAKDGTVFMAEIRHLSLSSHPARLVRRSASGEVSVLLDEDQGYVNQFELALDPRGGLLLLGSRKEGEVFISKRMWRYLEGTGAEMLPETTLFPDAVDGQGRWYEGWKWWRDGAPAVRRWDPASGTIEVIAGPGGRFLAGTGVDDGVAKPTHPGFDEAGNMYLLDKDYKQVKRLPADGL